MRPEDIEELLPTLEALATHGGAQPVADDLAWLRSVGAAVASPGTAWAVPSAAWLEAASPARDRLDLLRRTAIRDPGYRAHLDLSLSSVLCAIGVAERWRRFEELVGGPFLSFAPRFVQLLEWLEHWRSRSCRTFDGGIWQEAQTYVTGADGRTFANWDQKLWGVGGNTSTLFPLLQDQYVPLLEHPVHLCLELLRIERSAETLLRALVDAARTSESVVISAGQRDAIGALLRMGVPLRLQAGSNGTQVIAGLVGAVCLSAKVEPGTESLPSPLIAAGLPEHALGSSVGDFELQALESLKTFWECADAAGPAAAIAFLSISDQLRAWPEQRQEVPPWTQLPVAQSLRSTTRARRDSPEADEALQTVSNHLFFGFLLQVLLLESLDRELGEETLVLAPPTDRRVDDIEGATRVFYRPRRSATGVGTSSRPESYDLGSLDAVFSELARAVGIRATSYAYRGSDLGPWSRALRLLRSAELLVGLYDRWSIAPQVLDRLHGGGMMTAVIRRGRQFRERLHTELQLMWTVRRDAARPQEVLHG